MGRRLGHKGQSTLEFTLTLVLFFGFFLFYFQLAMVFAFGSFAHYATFMAARSYLAAGAQDASEQAQRATTVMAATVKAGIGKPGMDRFPSFAKGYGQGVPTGVAIGPLSGYFNMDDRDYSWLQGVRYTFRSRLFMIPLAGLNAKQKDQNGYLTLTAESWLGREPSSSDCQSYMGGQTRSGSGGAGWIFDNGC